MTTPFDTTRLDEECERIAREMAKDQKCQWAPHVVTVCCVLLDIPEVVASCGPRMVADIRSRHRPKMVTA